MFVVIFGIYVKSAVDMPEEEQFAEDVPEL